MAKKKTTGKRRPRTSFGLVPPPEAEVLTPAQAMRVGTMGRSYFYRHLALPGRGRECWIPVFQVGRCYRIPRKALLVEIEKRMGTSTKRAVAV